MPEPVWRWCAEQILPYTTALREPWLGEAGHVSFRGMGYRFGMAEVSSARSKQSACNCARLG